MTQHSSAEVDPVTPASADIPLSERPLVSDDQNTVVSGGSTEPEQHADGDFVLSASAREIRERLFGGPGAPDDNERGLRLGHFEVEKRIGSGGMGAVFRAHDLELHRDVALKVLHPQTAADPALVARFRNEARACAQLNHDNVARVFFTGQQDGVHFIAYEYAEGRTIRELIVTHGMLTPADTVNYGIQVTLALSHIDAAGIVHRDIKPSNIILTNAGRIKVVDLGLARREVSDSVGELTVDGTTLGTFDYLAPEQARDPRMADTRSDIYSLGCTMYHMLTGQPPYPEGTALQKLLDHQGKAPPEARSINPDVPAPLAAIVQRMMNTDPDLRYQDPGQLLADLIELAAQMGLRSVPAEGIVWRRIPVRKIRELSGSIFVSAAVIAIAGVALAMHLLPSRLEKSDDEVRSLVKSVIGHTDKQREGAATGGETNKGNQSSSTPKPTGNGEETGGTAASKGAASVPVPPAVQKPRFVVKSVDGTEASKDSLAEAWSQAQSGDVIVLDFSGPLQAPIPCMTPVGSIEPQIITIRAAEGQSPILEFEGEEDGERPSPGRLFYLRNNLNLKLQGVHLRVTVRDIVPTDEWVLFEFNGSNRVELQDCTIEVQNGSRIKTAVFRLSDSTTGFADDSVVRLNNVSVRGGCDLIRVRAQPTGRIELAHSFFALDGSLIYNSGSESMLPQGALDVQLEHVTSILNEAAFVLSDSDALDGGDPDRTVPQLAISSQSCVYSSLAQPGVLVHCQGNVFLEELQELISWNGRHNFYHNVQSYWKLESGTFDIDSTVYLFEDWQDHWARITDSQEDDADEFETDVWNDPDQLIGLRGEDLARLSTRAVRLNPSEFNFSSDSNSRHRLNENGSMPGANSDIPEFPRKKPTPPVEIDEESAAPE